MIGLHMVYGKKRAGKTMYCAEYIWRTLGTSDRWVITNLAVLWPGAEEYVSKKWGLVGSLHDRVFIERDPAQLRYFYLMAGDGWKVPRVEPDAWKKGERLDCTWAYRWKPAAGEVVETREDIWDLTPSRLGAAVSRGEIERVLCSKLPHRTFLLDEIQNIFPATMGMGSDPALKFWLTQQSKLSCDVICTTQEPDWIEKSFRDLADDWMFVKNWGRERRGFFRGPKRATWAKYPTLPGKNGGQPIMTGTFGIRSSDIWTTYDTSAGVGIEGGLTADKEDKVGGLHWSWLVGLVVCLAVLLWYLPGWALGVVGNWTHRSVGAALGGSKAPAVVVTESKATGHTPGAGVTMYREVNRNTVTATNDTKRLTGVVTLYGQATAYFSDGEAVGNQDKRFQGLLRRAGRIAGCRIEGKDYWLTTGHL